LAQRTVFAYLRDNILTARFVDLSGGKYRFAISNALLIQATVKSLS